MMRMLVMLALGCGAQPTPAQPTPTPHASDVRALSACVTMRSSVRETVLEGSYNLRVRCAAGELGGTRFVVREPPGAPPEALFAGCGGAMIVATSFLRDDASWTMEGTSEGRQWRYTIGMRGDCDGHGELTITGDGREEQTLSVRVSEVHHPVLQ